LLAAAILDGLDGRVARKLGVDSPVGAQLDSLADFLNFCIAPSLILYRWVFEDFYFFGWLVVLIYLTAGAWRLARFNVMYSQGAENVKSNYFVGMPSPAGALMVFAPIILTLEGQLDSTHIVLKAFYVVLIGVMMASQVRTPSLKNLRLSKGYRRYAFILVIAVTFIFWMKPILTYLFFMSAYAFSIIFVNIRRYIKAKQKIEI